MYAGSNPTQENKTMTERVSHDDELEPADGEETMVDEASDPPPAAADGLTPDEDDLRPADDDGLPPPEEMALEADDEVLAESEDAELVALRGKLEEVNDRHLRLAAEFNNFRRRSEQERLEAWSRAQADLVASFLDVLDDLHRVADLDLTNATVEAIMEGIDLVEKKLVRVLGDCGAESIDPLGEDFDPERMEAMMRVPTEVEEEDDTVAQVFQKGYTLKGILVRPARVSVHKYG